MPVAVQELDLAIIKGPETGIHRLAHTYMPPHYFLSWLYENYMNEFMSRILGGEGGLQAYGSGFHADDPRRLGNPIYEAPDLTTHAVPLAIHGDGVPCTTKGPTYGLPAKQGDHFSNSL